MNLDFYLCLQIEHAACQTNFTCFDSEQARQVDTQFSSRGSICGSFHKQYPYGLRPEPNDRKRNLVRSESENMDYSSKIRDQKSVSLSSLLCKVAESGQLSPGQSFVKLKDQNCSSEGKDTVIFIKSCCMKHEDNKSKLTKNEMVNKTENANTGSLLLDANTKQAFISEAFKKSTSENRHSKSVGIAETQDSKTHTKHHKSKKKHKSSRQKKVIRQLIIHVYISYLFV